MYMFLAGEHKVEAKQADAAPGEPSAQGATERHHGRTDISSASRWRWLSGGASGVRKKSS
jgi:hypothetical protein